MHPMVQFLVAMLVPWWYLFDTLTYIPRTIVNLVKKSQYATFLSFNDFKYAWFAEFWGVTGSQIKEWAAPRVEPLIKQAHGVVIGSSSLYSLVNMIAYKVNIRYWSRKWRMDQPIRQVQSYQDLWRGTKQRSPCKAAGEDYPERPIWHLRNCARRRRGLGQGRWWYQGKWWKWMGAERGGRLYHDDTMSMFCSWTKSYDSRSVLLPQNWWELVCLWACCYSWEYLFIDLSV